MSVERRREMVGRERHKLSLSRRCRLPGISRGSLCCRPRGESQKNLALMRRIDEQSLKTPWHGARQMARTLRRQGHPVGRKRVGRLMRLMGLRSLAPGPDTGRKHPTHPICPYLLRDRRIDAPNQVWCDDVTYIPLAHGFVYLVAIMDWHTRHVLSWQLSITQEASFCLDALDAALERYGKPEIFNTDEGSQFTSRDWTDTLEASGIRISMDGKGRWLDNVFIERLWRSLKQECVYLNAFDSVRDCQASISAWMEYYNRERTHSSLGDLTPSEACETWREAA